MRIRLFEFEDLSWFPDTLRHGMTDYLRFLFDHLDMYAPVLPLLSRSIKDSDENTLLDLCSGSGGPLGRLCRSAELSGIRIILSDKFPNLAAYENLNRNSAGRMEYIPYPVDAMQVPPALTGFRSMFSGFHHFDVAAGKNVLKDAVNARSGIAIFDGGDRNIFIILAILVFHPLLFLIFTPFIRPFRWSRILFTYLIPLIPLCTVWDGVVSILHLHSPACMQAMGESAGPEYRWQSGRLRNRWGMRIGYLIGLPPGK
jgi:hypothetical protein